MELLAVPFGDDGLQGDSCFYPGEVDAVPATEESTFEELLAAWKKLDPEERGQAEELMDNEVPAGFWLLTKENLGTALMAGEVECYSDSQTYTVNRIVKMLCHRLCFALVGTWPEA